MLAIQANYHEGHIQLSSQGLPRDAKVIVLFLDPEVTDTTHALSPDQLAALRLQSQTGFAQNVLLNPAEDCWNHV
jgi:hypothetical protein